jgi:hypothetical protein
LAAHGGPPEDIVRGLPAAAHGCAPLPNPALPHAARRKLVAPRVLPRRLLFLPLVLPHQLTLIGSGCLLPPLLTIFVFFFWFFNLVNVQKFITFIIIKNSIDQL